MAALTVNERAIHLNPVTANVQDYKQLKPEHELRVKHTQHHDQAGSGASVEG